MDSFPERADISSVLLWNLKIIDHMTVLPCLTRRPQLGSGPWTPKEVHQWTEPSIHRATLRPAMPTTAPRTPTATPTNCNTAHIRRLVLIWINLQRLTGCGCRLTSRKVFDTVSTKQSNQYFNLGCKTYFHVGVFFILNKFVICFFWNLNVVRRLFWVLPTQMNKTKHDNIMRYYCTQSDRAAVSDNSPSADFISCTVKDNNRQNLPRTETSHICFAKLPEHLQTHLKPYVAFTDINSQHTTIHTRCTSACEWRSCLASSLEIESLCSSFFQQVWEELD